MGGAAASMGYSSEQRSNAELTNCLRANFENAIFDSMPNADGDGHALVNGNGNGTAGGKEITDNSVKKVNYTQWTSTFDHGKTVYVPATGYNSAPLQEEREQYDITLKLFYLPGMSPSRTEEQTREALNLVLKELKVQSIDLLIISFPGIYFDEQTEDCPEKIKSRGPVETTPEPIDVQIEIWRTLERLHDEGLVLKLGLSEFGTERLQPFLEHTRIRPAVNQINLRDCCSVPKPLLSLAKTNSIELLVHNDCTNVLPRGTLRELLGRSEDGAGVLASDGVKAGKKPKGREGGEGDDGGIRGEVEPQWVIKYTAVVQNRGVVENKGYFAVAEVHG